MSGLPNRATTVGRPFAQTQWTLILRARDQGTPEARAALEEFARAYWPPLYQFIRREGYDRCDAQDLTQAFYQHFLQSDLLARVTERRGKFRSFLLTCLKHFLADRRDHDRARKRGGGRQLIALDALEAEERSALEPVEHLTADQIFERRWAQAVMDRAALRLRDDYAARGQLALYDCLKELEPGHHGEGGYAAVGRRLGLSEQAVKNAVLTFRRRLSERVRTEIRQMVGTSAEVEEEIRHLLEVLAR